MGRDGKGYLYESRLAFKFRVEPGQGLDKARRIHQAAVTSLSETVEAAGGEELLLEESRVWADESNFAPRRPLESVDDL